MFRWIVFGLGACLLASVTCVFGWFVARVNGRPDVAIHFAVVLKWSLYVMAAAAVYSAAVGAYHTFLSVTGLDGGGGEGEEGRAADAPPAAGEPPAAGAPAGPSPREEAVSLTTKSTGK